MIQHGSSLQAPAVVEGVTLAWERKCTPGRLAFTVVKDAALNFQEGDPVKLMVDGTPMFYGFVFTKKRDKDGTIDVTAYDQLRYLKNRDTITEEGLTASDLLRRLAADFQLRLGTVEDTGYAMETVVEENQTLFDMLQNAIDETLQNTGQLFVLYDDCGSLCLKNVNSLKTDLLIDAAAAENFDYSSSIDEQTYNKIKLTFNNEKTGKREVYTAQDGGSISQWGVLQYFERLQSETGADARANALLGLYNRKTRKLTVRNAFGRPDIRAGSAVMVSLNLGDMIANQFLMVEKIVHTFRGEEHFMDLTLVGGEFVA